MARKKKNSSPSPSPSNGKDIPTATGNNPLPPSDEVRAECERALTFLRCGNHIKADRLMKDLFHRQQSCALFHRVHATVRAKHAESLSDPRAKRRLVRDALNSARRATVLSPSNLEFAHFYAKLSFDCSDGPEEASKECERALAVSNPLDPARESPELLDESQQRTPEGRIAHYQEKLRSILRECQRINMMAYQLKAQSSDIKAQIKKAAEAVKDYHMKIDVQAVAAQLNQKIISTSPQPKFENDSPTGTPNPLPPFPSSSPGPGAQRAADRKKQKNSKKLMENPRNDQVRSYLESLIQAGELHSFVMNVPDLKEHCSSSKEKDSTALDVLLEALAFAQANDTWKFWACCSCDHMFGDSESLLQHVGREHVGSLPPEFLFVNPQEVPVMPQEVHGEWVDQLFNGNWKPIDADAAVKMIEQIPEYYVSPVSNDAERITLLKRIHAMFRMFIKYNYLTVGHLNLVLKLAMEEVQRLPSASLLLNHGVNNQSTLCIRLLSASQLRKVLKFLQLLSQTCELGRYSEQECSFDDAMLDVPRSEVAERMFLTRDSSKLILDAQPLSKHSGYSNADTSCADDGIRCVPDVEAVFSWLYRGPSIGESLSAWTQLRKERKLQGVKILEMLEKEFNLLHSLCNNKRQRLIDLKTLLICQEKLKKRENAVQPMSQSNKAVPRKWKEKLAKRAERENEVMMDALSDVLKVAQALRASKNRDGETPEPDIDDDYDSRVWNSLDREDACIEAAIQKLKDELSMELSIIDARIMRNLAGTQRLKLKLEPASTLDYLTVLMPLVKSFLQLSMEDMAEKFAIKKSKVASKAFLAELERDGTKNINKGGDHPKQTQEKSKDNKKSNDSKKSKGRKVLTVLNLAVGCNEQPHQQENAVQPEVLPATDGNLLKSEHVTTDSDLKEQEEEYRLKIEDEVERKLEEALEYQRWIENEAKQKVLSQKNKAAATSPYSVVEEPCPVDSDLNSDYIGPQEKLDCNKKATLHANSSPEGIDSGDFHCSEAVMPTDHQNLDRNRSKNVTNNAEKSLEIPSPEDDSVAFTNEPTSNISGEKDVFGTGLKNEVGENNCFLNVIIQALWHIRRFRDELHRTLSMHEHGGNPCVLCALYEVFTALSKSPEEAKRKVIDPTSLRISLSNLDSNKLQLMNDASEVFQEIVKCLHQAFTSSGDGNAKSGDRDCVGTWDCESNTCIAHTLFGMDFHEKMECYHCGLEFRNLKYTSYFHDINATELRAMKTLYPDRSFDELLKNVEMKHKVHCDTYVNGCGKPNCIRRVLATPPHVFTTVLGWNSENGSADDISATLEAITTEVDIGVLYGGIHQGCKRHLVSVVCHCGLHYLCFAYSAENKTWVMYDDQTVKVAGTWDDVRTLCNRGQFQPIILFFEAVN